MSFVSSDFVYFLGDASSSSNQIVDVGGDDVIITGSGNDNINIGVGNDIVLGGEGTDFITTGDCDDVIRGGQGSDFISTGARNDTILIVGTTVTSIVQQK